MLAEQYIFLCVDISGCCTYNIATSRMKNHPVILPVADQIELLHLLSNLWNIKDEFASWAEWGVHNQEVRWEVIFTGEVSDARLLLYVTS